MAVPARVFQGCPVLAAGLTPHSAVPPLRRTLWHPTMHHVWCTPRQRACVVAVLVAELRLDVLEDAAQDALCKKNAAVPGAGLLELVRFFWPTFATNSSAHAVDAKLDLLAKDGSPALLKLMLELGHERAEESPDDAAAAAALPSLPHDVWLLVLEFVPRHRLGRP